MIFEPEQGCFACDSQILCEHSTDYGLCYYRTYQCKQCSLDTDNLNHGICPDCTLAEKRLEENKTKNQIRFIDLFKDYLE